MASAATDTIAAEIFDDALFEDQRTLASNQLVYSILHNKMIDLAASKTELTTEVTALTSDKAALEERKAKLLELLGDDAGKETPTPALADEYAELERTFEPHASSEDWKREFQAAFLDIGGSADAALKAKIAAYFQLRTQGLDHANAVEQAGLPLA